MALPVGVSTCTVTYGSALTYLGEVSTISASLTADRSVVWSATGVSLNSGGDQLTANAGLALSFSVPHVDQTGFVNNAGDAVTNWYYTLTGVVTFATGEKMSFRKNFQVLVGQSTLDLDLIPDNATVLPAVVVDAPPVTSVAGLTGAVSAGDLGDALSATFGSTGVLSASTTGGYRELFRQGGLVYLHLVYNAIPADTYQLLGVIPPGATPAINVEANAVTQPADAPAAYCYVEAGGDALYCDDGFPTNLNVVVTYPTTDALPSDLADWEDPF